MCHRPHLGPSEPGTGAAITPGMNTKHTIRTVLAAALALTSIACGAGSMSVEGDTVTETRNLQAADGTVLTAVVTYPTAMLGDPRTEVIDELVVRLPSSPRPDRVHPSLRPQWMQVSLNGDGAENYELRTARPEAAEQPEVHDQDIERAASPGAPPST